MSIWQEQLAGARTCLRQAIRDSALRLIAERGMPNVSMSAVAEAAGVSRQTLYNHYADLESIVLEAARLEIEPVGGIIGEVVESAPDAPTALEIFIRGNLSPGQNEVMLAGGGMSPEGEGRVFEMLEPIHQHLRGILRRGVAEGTFRADVDPEDLSEILFHMIGSGRKLIFMGRDPARVADNMVGLVMRAVQS